MLNKNECAPVADEPTGHEMLAQVLLLLDRTDEAAVHAQHAVDLDPSWADAHVTLGRALLSAGTPHLALPSLQAALSRLLASPDVSVHVPLGDGVLSSTGDDPTAAAAGTAAAVRALQAEIAEVEELCRQQLLRRAVGLPLKLQEARGAAHTAPHAG